MEGQSNQEKPPKMTLFNSGGSGNRVCHSAEDFEKNGNRSQGTCLPEPFQNYVEYLTEATPYLPNTTAEYALGSCYPPVGSLPNNVNGLNRTETNLFFNDPGKACCFKATDSSAGIDFRKVGFWRPNSEGHQSKKFATNQLNHHAESQAPWKEESAGDKHSPSKFDPRVTVAEPGFLPKSRSSSSKQKATAADRQRRQRIADNLKALHGLLPAPAEACSAYILDDVIDYVKYLQLQIKELSGRRLQESTVMPLTFREGYGHYINQQMLNEPLEEMMGKLVEENPEAAAQLLENKGLFLLPLSLAEDLRQAMHMFGGIPRV